MKSILVLFFIMCNVYLFSQNQGIELPKGVGGMPVYGYDKNRMIKELRDLEKYSPDELTISSKWWYYLGKSGRHLYLGKDSSLYYFYEAYKIKPEATCNTMSVRHNHFIKALEEERKTGIEDGYIKQIKKETGKSIFSWYLWDLPDFDEFAFIDTCDVLFPPKVVEKSTVRDSTLNSEIIRRRDEQYRKSGEMDLQKVLDQINRDFIDSLYALKGSLDSFDEEEIYQFSMVAHHSEDCDWVYMWTERLIELSNKGYTGKSLLGPLLDRMFAPDGYCTKQDKQKRDYFIYLLKDKYPGFAQKNNLLNW